MFCYVTAEYKTKSHVKNVVVIWDKIVLRGEEYSLDLINENAEYLLADKDNGLTNNDFVLRFNYYTIPFGGLLRNFQDGESRFETKGYQKYNQNSPSAN